MTTTISKAPTGVEGLDEITRGGLPRGRVTLVTGGPGTGKSLLGAEFLLRTQDGADAEPAVLVSFEEDRESILANLASIGYDAAEREAQGVLRIDHIRIDPRELEAAGSYDLEGLLVRLRSAVEAVGATRVVLDTPDLLFASLNDPGLVRHELTRLLEWLEGQGVTTLITAEAGGEGVTRRDIEAYVADCVVVLDHDLHEGTATRRLRVMKYRGSGHGTDPYPFVITDEGIVVTPATSMRLDYPALDERVSTGVPALDGLMGGEGFHRGSVVLVSGEAGTGKSSLGVSFALASAARGEPALYVSFEESPSQIERNMASIGMDVAEARRTGNLTVESLRPTTAGLEVHLGQLQRLVRGTRARTVVLDPVTAVRAAGDDRDVRLTLLRLIDVLKEQQITTMVTSLLSSGGWVSEVDTGVSSLVDQWILLRNVEQAGERNRTLQILKARGIAHSNQVREFVLGEDGISLLPVEVRDGTVLVGSQRLLAALEAEQRADRAAQRIAQAKVVIDNEEKALEAQIALLRAKHQEQVTATRKELEELERQVVSDRAVEDELARRRT